MSHAQSTIDALEEAGRLLAPILQAEKIDSHEITIGLRRNGFAVFNYVGNGYENFVSGEGETLSSAFFDYLAQRSDKLAEIEAEERRLAEFEEWRSQREVAA